MSIPRVPPIWFDAAGVGVAILLTAGAWLVGIAPRLEARAESDVLRDELHAKEGRATELLADLNTAVRNVESMRTRVAERRVELSTASQLNRRLRDLNLLAESVGVQVGLLSPGDISTAGPVHRVAVRLQGSAPTEGVDRFLRELHDRFPDLRVQSLKIGVGGTETDGTPTFGADLVWFVAPENVGGTASASAETGGAS